MKNKPVFNQAKYLKGEKVLFLLKAMQPCFANQKVF